MRQKLPLMILGDSPTTPTGLGRITRELVWRIVTDAETAEVFDVATLGFGGPVSSTLPWRQYRIRDITNYAVLNLPEAWTDFAGTRRGVLFSIWNIAWAHWLAEPQSIPDGMFGGGAELREFLLRDPFDKWAYFAIDAEGPQARLVEPLARVAGKFDRVLAYTRWAARLIEEGMGNKADTIPHLPHGLETSVFYPRDRKRARKEFRKLVLGKEPDGTALSPEMLLLGVVATNSSRKDWPLAFEITRLLLDRGENVGLLIRTDALCKHWDLLLLAQEFGVPADRVIEIPQATDEQMAWFYAACDVTLAIGRSEGWGLPASESLGCGTPVVHGRYGGALEFLPENMLVDPVAWFYEGQYACKYPVFRAEDWAAKVLEMRGTKAELDARYHWRVCWLEWKKWLLDGVERLV